MEPTSANEIIGRIKSTSIEIRLVAIQEAQRMFNDYFNSNDSLAEWAKKALTIEVFYNVIRDELRQTHVRIGHKQATVEETPQNKEAKKSTVAKKKSTSPKGFDFNSMMMEFAKKLEMENKK
jgi:hypothetical protein